MKQRGIALLVVLWVLALLSVLLAGMVGISNLQSRQGLWQRQHTQALLAAEAGVALAVQSQRALNPEQRWAVNAPPRRLRFDDTELAISLSSEQGKLDLNAAPGALLGKLLQACGASPAQARTLGQALERRRGGGEAPLRLVEELRELPGMSQPLYQCAEPHVTLWSGLASPEPRLASAWLRRALALPHTAAAAGAADSGPVFSVLSQATLASGDRAELRVTLILNPSKEAARPYRVLRWQE